MKSAISIVAASLVFALALAAASIDGKWSFETKTKGKQGEQTVTTVLDLKASGDRISGAVSRDAGRRARSAAIQDGKLDGNKFSFTSIQQTRKGDQKVTWRGTIEGDQLTGTFQREGARREMPFTAKRK